MHGVLVVDKPRGPTSHDVVARVRKALGTRQVGHAGTLDPMATGVLVVAVGEATKLVPYLTARENIFLGREKARFGLFSASEERRETRQILRDLDAIVRDHETRIVVLEQPTPPVVALRKRRAA